MFQREQFGKARNLIQKTDLIQIKDPNEVLQENNFFTEPYQ